MNLMVYQKVWDMRSIRFVESPFRGLATAKQWALRLTYENLCIKNVCTVHRMPEVHGRSNRNT